MRASVRSLCAALALAAAALGCGGGEDAVRPRNAVLITLDTTRRDALGCYGAPPEITPHLDALALESLVYDNARSVAPITLPAHASMLTGLYPPRHGIRDNQLVPLTGAAVTVAERARDAGFQTAAFVSVVILGDLYGVDQGFERFDQPRPDDVGRHGPERDGPATVAAAVRWLEGRDPSRPYLLWVHLFDAHGPNEPPPAHLARAGGDPYLGDVAFQDDAVGTLLDALRADPGWDDTLVMVVGDHGEALGEHGEETHSTFVYDATLAVPFLVRDPGVAPGRSRAVVSVVDVFPTLIEALALGGAGDVDGVSLHRRDVPQGRGVYFESYHGLLYFQWSPLAGWADADGKYIHSSAPELYAVGADPGELENVLPAAPERAERYRAALERIAGLPALAADDATVDRDVLPSLADLGYAGSSDAREVPDPLDAGDAPSPHQHADLLRAVMVARRHGLRGEHAEAVALLDQVLARDPTNHEAWNRKGAYLMAMGRTAEAIEALERFLEIGPEWPNVWVNLAKCHAAEGAAEEAERWARKTLEIDPDNEAALALLVELLNRAGRSDEAAPLQLRLIDLR